jgi:hypothetical protein
MYSRLLGAFENMSATPMQAECETARPGRFNRDVKRDIHTGLDKYIEFLQELKELHPEAVRLVLKIVVSEIAN